MIVEEPEEDQAESSGEEQEEEDLPYLSMEKRISTISGLNPSAIATKICVKILSELIEVVQHSIAEAEEEA